MLLPLLFLAASSIRPDAAATPYRQPQIAAGNGIVVMAFGGGQSIYFASSKDKGQTFSAPVKVAETGALALGRHRGPRIVMLKDAIVISAIAGEKVSTGAHAHGLPEAGNLLVWRSTDQGKTWLRGAVANDVPGSAREGLFAMTAFPDGKSIFAAWLDLRGKGTKLYGSRSNDGGRTWSKNVAVYESPERTICECCHPSLAADATGKIWAMWRNVLDGSRDMYLAGSSDGVHFEPAVKQGEGTWKLNACPMDGGGFVVENGKAISAWRRDSNIFLAEPGTAEQLLGPGKDAAIARNKAGSFVAWTRDGGIVVKRPGAAEPSALSKDGGFVSLFAIDDRTVLAAWESQGSIETTIVP